MSRKLSFTISQASSTISLFVTASGLTSTLCCNSFASSSRQLSDEESEKFNDESEETGDCTNGGEWIAREVGEESKMVKESTPVRASIRVFFAQLLLLLMITRIGDFGGCDSEGGSGSEELQGQSL